MNNFKVGDVLIYTYSGFENYRFFNGKVRVVQIVDCSRIKIKWIDKKTEQAFTELIPKNENIFSKKCFTLWKKSIDDNKKICKNSK